MYEGTVTNCILLQPIVAAVVRCTGKCVSGRQLRWKIFLLAGRLRCIDVTCVQATDQQNQRSRDNIRIRRHRNAFDLGVTPRSKQRMILDSN
jgi:hypothetical protein